MCLSLIEIYLLIGAIGLLSFAIVIWTFGGNDLLPIGIAGIVAIALMMFVDIRAYLSELTLGLIFGVSVLISTATAIHFKKSSPLMPRKEVHAFTVATVTHRAKNTAVQLMGQIKPDAELLETYISTEDIPRRLIGLFISELTNELLRNKLSLSSLERTGEGRRVELERIPTRKMRKTNDTESK